MSSKMRNRQHPVKIFSYTTKYFWLLSIPLIRGLISLQFDFAVWVKGAWLDICTVTLILIFAFFRWYYVTFEFRNNSLTIRSGVFLKQKSTLLYNNITSVCIEKGILLLPFNACKIFIDTNCGSHRKADLKLTLKQKNVSDFKTHYQKYNTSNAIKYSYYPSKRHLVFFSLIFSNTLSGVILISTLFYQGGKIVSRELEEQLVNTVTSMTEKIATGLPPAAITVSWVVFGGWVLSFILNLLRHWSFKAERQGNNIIVKSGFITKRMYFLNSPLINYTDFRQNLLTIIFKISSVHIHCSGYGKAKRAIAVLIPITTKNEAFGSLNMLLPTISMPKTSIRPTFPQIRRFILFPLIFILVIPIVAVNMINIFPIWRDMIVFATIMFEIPFVWLLIVKIVSLYTTGIGYFSNTLTLKYCKMYAFHTVQVPINKVCIVKIKQSIFQKTTNNCNLILYTNAEKTKYHTINFLPYDKTIDFLNNINVSILK